MHDQAVIKWFAAHDDYHKASATYNARLELVRAERERDNWTMNCFQEYAALNDARRYSLAADSDLYEALRDDLSNNSN